MVAHVEGIKNEADAVIVGHLDGPRAVGVTGEGTRMTRTRHFAL